MMLLETATSFEFDSLHQLISTSSSILFIERLFDWVIRFLGRCVIFQEFDSTVKSLGDSSLLLEYTWIMMAGSEDKMSVLLAQVPYWGRYYLGVSALNNWKVRMETVVVADSDLVPVLICLFSVSSVSESQIVTSTLNHHPPKVFTRN